MYARYYARMPRHYAVYVKVVNYIYLSPSLWAIICRENVHHSCHYTSSLLATPLECATADITVVYVEMVCEQSLTGMWGD